MVEDSGGGYAPPPSPSQQGPWPLPPYNVPTGVPTGAFLAANNRRRKIAQGTVEYHTHYGGCRGTVPLLVLSLFYNKFQKAFLAQFDNVATNGKRAYGVFMANIVHTEGTAFNQPFRFTA